jgi:uncharacterized membrane protein YhaH (DUF805 family)
MTDSEWVDFSFRHQGEGYLVCSWDDAEAHIASGALMADTRITAFLPTGRKVMDARDLAQLHLAPVPPPVEVAGQDGAPDSGLDASPAAIPTPAFEPVLGAPSQPVIAQRPPKARVPRKVPPVSTAFKNSEAPPPPLHHSPIPPPRWLGDPVWIQPLHRYAEFSGRSTRLEYWSFAVAQWIALFVVILFATAIGETLGAVVTALVVLALVVPNIAVTVRRLHDADLSAWLLAVLAVPLAIGGAFAVLAWLVLLVLTLLPGTAGANKHGAPSLR